MHYNKIHHMVWFLLALSWKVTIGDDDKDVSKCQKELNSITIDLCYNASQYQSDSTVTCPNSNDIVLVTGLFLSKPNNDSNLSECKRSSLDFYYQKPEVSCNMKSDPKMENLAQQIIEGMSGKTKENINISLVTEKLNQRNLSTLPQFPPYTILSVTYKCFNKNGATPMVDMCESSNKTYNGENVHLTFDPSNFTSPVNVSSSSGCSCIIKPSKESITINLIDVRLEGDSVLSINDSNNKRSSAFSNHPIWLAQGEDFFNSSAAVVQVELSKINPARPPQSVWFELQGQDLTITCGSVISKKTNSSGREFAFLYLLAIIPAALAVFLIIVCIVQVRKRCNKMKYKIVDKKPPSNANSVENDYHSDSKSKNMSNTYVEVEPDYNELDESSSIKQGLVTEGKETTHFKISADLHNKPKENGDNSLYNHLRETNVTKSDVNLYDTAEGDDYSTLHRKKDEEIIDNVYSTTLT